MFVSLFSTPMFNLKVWLIETIVFITSVLFFEFILILLDSYIEKYSGGIPVMTLLFNFVLAVFIFPMHS